MAWPAALDPLARLGVEADLDEVQGMDPGVTDGSTARVGDRIPKRAGPDVLDQGQGRCATGGEGVGDVVHLAVGDEMTVRSGLGARAGSGFHAVLAVEAESDERADRGAELLGL